MYIYSQNISSLVNSWFVYEAIYFEDFCKFENQYSNFNSYIKIMKTFFTLFLTVKYIEENTHTIIIFLQYFTPFFLLYLTKQMCYRYFMRLSGLFFLFLYFEQFFSGLTSSSSVECLIGFIINLTNRKKVAQLGINRCLKLHVY